MKQKILFLGDSITDMGRIRVGVGPMALGHGYVFFATTYLNEKYPGKYEIVNKGISGDTISDLVLRYEDDVIKEKPDVLTILIGVNDIWHRIDNPASKALKINKFVKAYDGMLTDIANKLPKCKIILMEPFFTHGSAVDFDNRYECFCEVYKYARACKKLSKKHNLSFVKLQKAISEGQDKYHEDCLYDGVHPYVIGAKIIANQWVKTFKREILK